MADSKLYTIGLLSSTAISNMALDVPTLWTLYTAPLGRKCVIDSVVIHSNSGSLAGMDDVDFGGGATAIDPVWIDNETGIGDMTTANSYMILRNDSNDLVLIDGDDTTLAARTFGMYVTLGSTATPITAVVDTFGYIF